MKYAPYLYSSTLKFIILSAVITISFLQFSCQSLVKPGDLWGDLEAQEKPWTRWWWMGNILNESDITYQLEAFAKAGLGGVEITPIYGVNGYDDQFINHLSPEWIAMLEHTIQEADRLGLGVDMILGTGWPYGGPQVEAEYAASRLHIKKIPLNKDEVFDSEINMKDPKQKGLAKLQHVFYFDNEQERVDLTPLLNGNNLHFTPATDTEIYALFCAKTRQKVKRNAPGGFGFTLDHLSSEALEDYLAPYDTIFPELNGKLRAIFNDSYEVYGADYSPKFLQEFKERRGYELLDYISVLDMDTEEDIYQRILCDYRVTMSDMLLENFAAPWTAWSNSYNTVTKYQAHGSPGNLIDLYAAADIPECEIFGSPKYDIPNYRRDTNNIRKGDSDKMMLKFCSSAAHLKGDELVSSESFTWLREHFKTALSHCKPVAEDFFFSGINHIFLHGSTYSPKNDPWPGFKFYASVNFNPTNNIWRDAPALFEYIGRCQAVLQQAKTDHQVLLYWPIHDAFTSAEKERLLFQFKIHSIEEWLTETSFYELANTLDEKGIGFDFISDQFIANSVYTDEQIAVSENASYKTIIVPEAKYIPLATLSKLLKLKQKGASVIFMGKPESVPGFHDYLSREKELQQILEENKTAFPENPELFKNLEALGISSEPSLKYGLKILRKNLEGNTLYFVANHTKNEINEHLHFNAASKSVLISDPLSGQEGIANSTPNATGTEVLLQLKPGQSLFLTFYDTKLQAETWKYYDVEGETITINNDWRIDFISGSNLPPALRKDSIYSWTNFGAAYEYYSGTARYTTSMMIDKLNADGYILDLGDVRESAKVYVNDNYVATLFAHPFSVDISAYLREGRNKLELKVTSLSANRIRKMEIDEEVWRKFKDINIVNIHYKEFDAASWEPQASGLMHTPQLIPVNYRSEKEEK